jgi:hypothetical protein
VSLVAIITVVGGAIADLVIPATARQHTHNPSFPPHAKFHNEQTIWLGVFSGSLAIFLLWFPERDWVFQFHLAVIVVALYWLSMLGASLLPGTRWVDPEFASQTRAILGMPPQLFLMNVLLCLIGSRDHTHMLNRGKAGRGCREEGHLSVTVNHREEVVTTLMTAAYACCH